MTYSPMKSLKEFHDTFAPNNRKHRLLDQLERRDRLITEEFEEVSEAIHYLEQTYLGMTSSSILEAIEKLSKELADLLYVVYGTAEELGIPLQEIFEEVHRSNMNKVWPDGEVHYNEIGKILKPPTYSPPDLERFFE